MTASSMLSPGFSSPVSQSQRAFRTVLDALANPGRLLSLDVGLAPPGGLNAATATALLALADFETPLWLPPALRAGAAGAWLRFHTGAPLCDAPAEAAFAVIEAEQAGPDLSDFALGSDEYPDRSTTVFVACAALEGGEELTLQGPGIPDRRFIAPKNMPAKLLQQLQRNQRRFPRGVDVVLSAGSLVIGLPRTTRILNEETR